MTSRVATPSRLSLAVLLVAMVGLFATTGCLSSKDEPLKGAASGKVFDTNGHALRGAVVCVYGKIDNTTTTNELGWFTLGDITPGQVKLVATANNKSVTKIIEVERGKTTENVLITFAEVDQLPPIITDVAVAPITENTARITWRTNEAADAIISYATGPIGIGSWTWTANSTAMVLVQAVDLTGLTPGTTYHFQIKCRDYAGNEGVSSLHQFVTSTGDAPATPQNLVIAPPTAMEHVRLTWSSNTEADLRGYNLYRAESRDGPWTKVNANPIANTASSTTYVDTGRSIAIRYYYLLKAVDVAGNESPASSIVSITAAFSGLSLLRLRISTDVKIGIW